MVELKPGDEEAIRYTSRTSSQKKLLMVSIEGEEVVESLGMDVRNTAVNSRDVWEIGW